MEFSKITVYKATGDVIVGSGSVEIDNTFFVRFAIMKNKTGNGDVFVKWPSRKGTDDKWYPDAGFTVNEEAGDEKYAEKNRLEKQIIIEFNKVIGVTNGKAPKKDDQVPPAEPKADKPIIQWA